jgi:anthranilate phosphoribosyltransferase
MRAAMIPVSHSFESTLDTCGTGGDGMRTLNLSTGAALIAAGDGVVVAKHGNRAMSSRTGSADVLEALGIPVTLSAEAAQSVLEQARITFMLAPTHHPAMRYAVPVRRELGIRTLFNCLGPLANPARVTHQLLGAYDDALRPVLARALATLGVRRAWVVRGVDGLDEMSPHDVTRVTVLDGGQTTEIEVSPEDFGLSRLPREAVAGAESAHNAEVLTRVLAGEAHPARDAFVLNGAAALVVAHGLSLREAARRAAESIDSGNARRALARWREAAQARAT